METIGISHFKAHALKVLDRVHRTREGVVITKRGKPVAQVLPVSDSETPVMMGHLSDTLLFEQDIVSPLGGDMWECAR